MNLTLFDCIVIFIISASLLFGLWRGVVREILALVAWVLALVAAFRFGADVGAMLPIATPLLRWLSGCILVFCGVLIVMALIRLAINQIIRALGLSASDRILGMVFGFLRGLIIVIALTLIGGLTSAPKEAWWRDAMLSPALVTLSSYCLPWLPVGVAQNIHF